MKTTTHLQAAATIGVLAAIAASELAGLALAASPGSAWLWYLNFSVLTSLRPGLHAFSDFLGVNGLPLIALLSAAVALMIVAAIARMRLITGIGANVAMIACFAFFKLWFDGKTVNEVASLGGFIVASSDQTLLWILTVLAVLASLSMHYSYIRRAFARG